MYDFFDYDYPLFRPPSEAYSQIFQITLGCSQNHCTFCGMYKTKRFRLRTVAEVVAEMRRVPEVYRHKVKRVFLADGDALVYPQDGLLEILERLQEFFPALARVGIYASPNSLTNKTPGDLQALRARKLRILYFGLESGDDQTLTAIKKGFSAEVMLEMCSEAHAAGLKLSVTAILGLAGQERSLEHARATAAWITRLSPAYFSLLTLFQRHNDDFLRSITPLTNGGTLEEALEIVRQLSPRKTILRSNHASNILHLEGSYPKDRNKVIAQAERAIHLAQQHPDWFGQVPDYCEELY